LYKLETIILEHTSKIIPLSAEVGNAFNSASIVYRKVSGRGRILMFNYSGLG